MFETILHVKFIKKEFVDKGSFNKAKMSFDSILTNGVNRKYDENANENFNFDFVQNHQITSSNSTFQFNNILANYNSNQAVAELNSDFSLDFCKVCNDKATGIHYGVATCEGCKVVSFSFTLMLMRDYLFFGFFVLFTGLFQEKHNQEGVLQVFFYERQL